MKGCFHMKKALLRTIIAALSLLLISCAAPDRELPATEITTYETTVVCNGDCTTEWFTIQNTVPACETGNLIAPSIFSSPEDEEMTNVTYHISVGNSPTMKVTLYGYKSEMMDEELYFKNNEPIKIKVEVKNETAAPVYQWQPTMCHGMTPSHEHEIAVSFMDESGNRLTNAHLDYLYFMGCPEAIEVWSLAPGESYEWNLEYFAGTAKESVIWRDPICDTEFSVDFDLYDDDIFTDGVCTFEGSIDFAFTHTANDDGYGNTEDLSLSLSLKVFYVGE